MLPETANTNFITSLQESLVSFAKTEDDVDKLYMWYLGTILYFSLL